MQRLLDTAARVVDHDVSVLILGATGTGKDRLAQALHACGGRSTQPFVAIDCAALPPELFEAELFGYERGTFTDAGSRKAGKLEMARRGTLYFDELSTLPRQLQAKLLRVLQDRRFERLGGNQSIDLDVRVITSSSLPAEALREDLLYRINVITLTMPALRERREDIPQLAREALRAARRNARGFDPEAMQMLCGYSWPGNVRQLRNVVERAALLETGSHITAASLPTTLLASEEETLHAATRESWTLEQLEAAYIREVLRKTRSNYSRAAEILGINRKTLLEKRRRYGIDS